MREQSQDVNIEPEAVVLEENQVIRVNDELQGDLGLQAVGCVQTTEAEEGQAEVTPNCSNVVIENRKTGKTKFVA